jgi:hypothetical protein
MPHEQTLGRKGVRLDVYVRPRDAVHETALADVGVPAHDEGPFADLDGRETVQVLTDLPYDKNSDNE